MSVLIRIAFRNLREHRSKTIIVGVILAAGVAVLTLGTAMIAASDAGMQAAYSENFTGDVMITGKTQAQIALIGNGGPPGTSQKIPTIPDYRRIREHLDSLPSVASYSPEVTGIAIMGRGDSSESAALLFGIEPDKYRSVFPRNITISSGQFLKPGQEGILLTQKVAQSFADKGEPVKPGDRILLTSRTQDTGFKIREVTVRGIFGYRSSNEILDMVCLLDIDDIRALTGMDVTAPDSGGSTNVSSDPVNLDDLFSSGGTLTTAGSATVTARTESGLLGFLRTQTEGAGNVQPDPTAYTFILLRLTDPAAAPEVISGLNSYFHSSGIEAHAAGWAAAAGGLAQLTSVIKNMFVAVILIISVVAIIIIMNTLVISVTERTAEIGTIRAIGGTRGFVRGMIVTETLVIAGVFGAIGIAFSILAVLLLNLTGIPAPNQVFAILFGGPTLHPILTLKSVLTSFAAIAVVGIVSSLYPVSVALRVPPVRAIQTE